MATKRAKGKLKKGDCRHGTTNAYYYWACRCEECREAGRRSNVASRERRKALLGTPQDNEKHGTVNAYVNACCRCEPCKAAYREDRARRHQVTKQARINLSELA